MILYTSTLSGDSLTQVTPDGEQFVDYFYYPNTQSILVKTVIDADGDQRFEIDDETNFVEMDLNAPSFGESIFPDDLKDVLKGQIQP